jgi:CheY-like chemotaxis protein
MQRTILLVEDQRYQFAPLGSELKERGWNVLWAQNVYDGLYELQAAGESKRKIDMAAIDLGIPPGMDNPLEGGIKLIREFRAMSDGESIPVLAYTSLTPKEFDYSLVVKHLLALRASFICLRPISDKVNFADLIEYGWLGYVVIAPQPADFLSKAIPDHSDPLDDKHWQTLSLLHGQLTYSQMAREMKLTVEAIKARVTRIKEILIELDELPYDAKNDDLDQWYIQKRVRYSRP